MTAGGARLAATAHAAGVSLCVPLQRRHPSTVPPFPKARTVTWLKAWLNAWLRTWLPPRSSQSPERQRALDLIAAVDAGGLPLHPARVNHIARGLGLEVSSRAKVDETVQRIRAALLR